MTKFVIALATIAAWNALLATVLLAVYRHVAVDHLGWVDLTWMDAFLTYLAYNVARAKFSVDSSNNKCNKVCSKDC